MEISRLTIVGGRLMTLQAKGDENHRSHAQNIGDTWRSIQGSDDCRGMLDPIHPLLKAEILRYGDFAQQCYDSFDNRYSSKYYGNSKRSRSSLGHRLEFKTCSNPGVQIEKGFLGCYNSIYGDSVRGRLSARDIVVRELTRLLNECKDEENVSITFTGHSLGAALATLNAYDVKQILMKENDYRKSVHVTVFSFASPRVGNLAFSQHLEEIGVKVLRVVNKWDIVPRVPGVFINENMGWLTRFLHWLPWAYVHVGVPITLDSNSSPVLKKSYNPASSHNLEVYLHLLDGFQGNNKLPFKPSGRDPALVNKYSDLLIDKLQIPCNWWGRRNKEIVRRIDGLLVYSPTTPTPVPLTPRLLYMRHTDRKSLALVTEL